MLLRFIGTYTHRRDSITLYGVTFNGREPSEMTDSEGIRRLSGHPEFEQVTVADTAPADDQPVDAQPAKRGRPRKH